MEEPNMFFVCAMGLGIVFIGLICLIFISMAASAIIRKTSREKKAEAHAVEPVAAEPIANRREFVAAVSAAIAEQLGTNINAIKIISIKKV